MPSYCEWCLLPMKLANIDSMLFSASEICAKLQEPHLVLSCQCRSRSQRAAPVMIRNNNQIREWKLRNDEKWETVFRSKSQQGPTLSIGCKPCLKFHAKGFCFEDCALLKSHISLSPEDTVQTANYIKELRGE